MFSMCHCWSRTSPGRGGWMKKSDKWSSMQVTMAGSTKWRQFRTARSMQESQNQVIYQASTIWFHGKDIRRKRILGSRPWRYNTFGSCLASSTTRTPTSRRQYPFPLIPLHPWQNQQSSSPQSGNKDDQQKALQSALKSEATRKVSESVWFSMKPEAGRWPGICLPGAKSVGEPALAG